MVPYVDAVVVVTVMCVLLFVLHVCMLRECECARLTTMLVWSIMSSAADVIGISVVCGMRDVGRLCGMCICLARGGVGEEGVK